MSHLPTLTVVAIITLACHPVFGQAKEPETNPSLSSAKTRPPGMVGFILDQQGADIVIKEIVPGSPAAAQKEIQPGDRLLSVAPLGGAAVAVRGMEVPAVTALIRGPEGSSVSLSIVHPGENDAKAKTIDLVRGSIELMESSALKPGEMAPELTGVTWIKGEPVTKFARDKVYLVECWATWCGPCVAGIPHLDALHRKYKDRGLVVIGQNVWEDDQTKIRQFVEKMGDKMSYRVAMDDCRGMPKGDAMLKGAMSDAWIRPGKGGSYGIPLAFLVGKDGKIVWSGNPPKLSEAMIETVLATPAGTPS